MVKELRIGQLITALQMGNLGKAQTLENTRLFATEVAPHLRSIWSDYPDLWTPQALAPVAAGERGAV
jgi:hypothetical protein